MPVIVASLGAWPGEAAKDDLAGFEAVELRLDLMDASVAGLPRIVSGVTSLGARVIATCRPGRISEQDRVALLCEAARLGAWAVDVEIDAAAATRTAVAHAAHSHGCRVIISHHDHERTPSRETLREIVRRSFESGADIVKIACCVVTLADNATLLGLLDDGTTAGRLAVVGMGSLGRVARIVAPLLGSPLAYVSPRQGLETAEGQLTRDALVRAWSVFEAPR
jgi:3-dehydroquinate dehydratase I